MTKTTSAILASFLAVLFAWWVGYALIGSPGGSDSAARLERSDSAPVIARSVDISDSDRSETRSARTEPQALRPLAYQGWEANMEGELSQACLSFSADITADNIAVLDYIDVQPEAKLAAGISGNRMCLSGFDFNNEYQITLKSGLPAANTERAGLTADQTLTVSFGDKPAFVAFVGDGIILPRIGAQGLGIETVNVETLSVEIARVGDRIIARRDPESGNNTAEGRNSWEYENAATEVRETIWSGEIDIEPSRNNSVTTVIPVGDMIGDLQPGAYVITAERKRGHNDTRPARAWRWIVSTDMALTSYQGETGLDVIVRSIDSANAMPSVKVSLLSRNNNVLGETVTSANGRAFFDGALLRGSGSRAPKMLMAYGVEGDYALLDLSRAALDLSDRDIAGRELKGDLDGYVFTDRGVYRPDERVNITAMMRNAQGQAQERPGDLKIIMPNGLDYRVERFMELDAGTLTYALDLPSSAPRGMWTAQMHADGKGLVGSVQFAVEDFVPQKISVDLKIDDGPLLPDQTRALTVQSDFLYGASGKDLDGEAEMRLRADPNPFETYKGYVFGDTITSFQERVEPLGSGRTDETGALEFDVSVNGLGLETSTPLRAEITAGISEPGGRYIRNSARIPVRTAPLYLGIKPNFEGGRVERNSPFSLSVIGLDPTGERIDVAGAKWSLVEEDWRYNWYRQRGRWNYRYDTRLIPVSDGQFDIDSDTPQTVSSNLNWGTYRLRVSDPKTAMETVYRFSVGWGGAQTSDSPDTLTLAGPTDPVRGGQMAKLTLNAPYAGVGELVIASDRVHEIRTIKIPKGGSEVSIKMDQDWGAGVYAMVTLYTPRTVSERPVPRRAVGLSYIPLDVSDKTLTVSIEAPDVVRPRRTQTVGIDVAGDLSGETFLTLAAIDEGILLITKYDSPSPEDYYFGKTALGIDMRDDYARMLNPNLGDPAIARSGGDSLGGEGLTVSPTKIVSLYSGPVTLRGGKASIDLDLPDFNGELRLMAVAWNDKAVGSAAQAMVVRDPVPANLALPRFLAPGDEIAATVTLDNVQGAPGEYSFSVDTTLSGGVTRSGAMTLPVGERQSEFTKFTAGDSGISDVSLSVQGPQNYSVTSDYQIQTRSPFFPTTRRDFIRITPGQSHTLSQTLFDNLDRGSAEAQIAFTRLPGLDPAGYAATLAKYPYGCTEQTVSSGLPLLYAADIGGIPGYDIRQSRAQIQEGVNRIVNRLSDDGAFGLWRPGDNYATAWVGTYAAEFLQRAKEKDFVVTQSAMETTYNGLKTITQMERYPSLNYDFGRRGYWRWSDAERKRQMAESAAYAHYVLARGGRGDLGDIRYFYDNHADDLRTAMSRAHIGAALKMMGDNVRAKAAFENAVIGLGFHDDDDYYQSALRDAAGLVAIANEVESSAAFNAGLVNLASSLKDPEQLNTQEKARVIMAIRAILKDGETLSVKVQGIELEGLTQQALLLPVAGQEPISFTNTGKTDIYLSQTVSGQPITAPEAFENGISLSKGIYAMDGKTADLTKAVRGDRFVVRVKFNSDINRSRQVVLADLLPAGFEIETVLTPADGEQRNGADGPYEWLGEISDFDLIEARDDRLVASLKTYRRDRYMAAYVVRAVTPGRFTLPGAHIEDMYRPADQALTPATRLTVLATTEG